MPHNNVGIRLDLPKSVDKDVDVSHFWLQLYCAISSRLFFSFWSDLAGLSRCLMRMKVLSWTFLRLSTKNEMLEWLSGVKHRVSVAIKCFSAIQSITLLSLCKGWSSYVFISLKKKHFLEGGGWAAGGACAIVHMRNCSLDKNQRNCPAGLDHRR